MVKVKNKELFWVLIILVIVLMAIAGVLVAFSLLSTYNAHLSFEGYCKWRGLEVVNQSADFGFCRNPSNGAVQKMVLYKGRWFLDGDLPVSCGFFICP